MAQKIMIQTKNKTFFVHKKNLPMVIEFAKTFKAKLIIVEVNDVEITELEDLATKFCDQNSYTTKVKYQELDVLYPKTSCKKITTTTKTRSQILSDAKIIKKYIKEKFCSNGTVSLQDLKKQFKELSVTDSCLSNHLANVRKELIKNHGYTFESSSKGEYKCTLNQ